MSKGDDDNKRASLKIFKTPGLEVLQSGRHCAKVTLAHNMHSFQAQRMMDTFVLLGYSLLLIYEE